MTLILLVTLMTVLKIPEICMPVNMFYRKDILFNANIINLLWKAKRNAFKVASNMYSSKNKQDKWHS